MSEARRLLTAIAAVKSDSAAASAASARLETLDDYERRVAARAAERARPPQVHPLGTAAVTDARPSDPRPAEFPEAVRPGPSRDRQTLFLLRKVQPGEDRVLGALTRVD